MGKFIINPHMPPEPRVFDNTFLWEESNIYVMANHRLALWCWLQCKDVFNGKHALIHIDEHIDARRWEGDGEPECLKEILPVFNKLKEMAVYESFQCPNRNALTTGRDTRPCITYDNFVHLAAKANLFEHYYIYSSAGDWHTGLAEDSYDIHKKITKVYNLEQDIKTYAGRCIVDVDLDFFDNRYDFPNGVTEDELLKRVLWIIAKNRKDISMITISLNESPGHQLWEKRQHQLAIIKDFLHMEVPVPIMVL